MVIILLLVDGAQRRIIEIGILEQEVQILKNSFFRMRNKKEFIYKLEAEVEM